MDTRVGPIEHSQMDPTEGSRSTKRTTGCALAHISKLCPASRGFCGVANIYRLFNVNKTKWRPKGRFPNQPKMANYARSIARGERMGVDGVKGCSSPVDGPGRRRSGARRGRASAGPGQFRARLICERNVGAGRLGVPVIRITVALARAAEIRVELCLKHRARNCERSVGGSGGSPALFRISSFCRNSKKARNQI